MNKTLYTAAMNNIKMSEDCEKKIMNAVNSPQITIAHKKKRIRFAPVIAAAIVLITGTLGVAAETGGFDWIKGFFNDKEMAITEDVTDIVAEFDNFNYKSVDGLELSPVGMIADETTLYCMVNVDKLPENMKIDNINVWEFYTDSVPAFSELDLGQTATIASTSHSTTVGYENDKSCLIFKLTTSYKALNDGDLVTLKLVHAPSEVIGYAENTDDIDICAEINFNIRFGDVKTLEVNYDEYKAVEVNNKKFFIDEMVITPLKISTTGSEIIYTDVTINNDVTVNMTDGTVVTAHPDSIASSGKTVLSDWKFDSPVNPDNIESVYISDLCLYSRE